MCKVWWIIYSDYSFSTEYHKIVNYIYRSFCECSLNVKLIKATDIVNAKFVLEQVSLPLPTDVLFWDKNWHIASILENMGINVFNESLSAMVCEDKICSLEKLSSIPNIIPRTVLVNVPITPDELHRKTQGFQLPLIVKYSESALGSNVFIVNTFHELFSCVLASSNKVVAIQEYLSYSPTTEIKLFSTRDKVISCMKRDSNILRPYVPNEAETKLAIAGCKKLGLLFAGVDIIYKDANTPVICELNTQPNLLNIFKCTGINVVKILINEYFN